MSFEEETYNSKMCTKCYDIAKQTKDKYCLDKQKVREAWIELTDNIFLKTNGRTDLINADIVQEEIHKFAKELGIERKEE